MAREYWHPDPAPNGSWREYPRAATRPVGSGLQIIPDIEPYRNVIDGKVIGGRRQHRDFLRAHGCIEVGNERVQRREAPLPEPDMAIKKAFHDLGYGD